MKLLLLSLLTVSLMGCGTAHNNKMHRNLSWQKRNIQDSKQFNHELRRNRRLEMKNKKKG